MAPLTLALSLKGRGFIFLKVFHMHRFNFLDKIKVHSKRLRLNPGPFF
jgi:hypothetical protein